MGRAVVHLRASLLLPRQWPQDGAGSLGLTTALGRRDEREPKWCRSHLRWLIIIKPQLTPTQLPYPARCANSRLAWSDSPWQ